MKNQYSKFGIFENKYLIGAFILGTLMQVAVVVVPQIADVFKLVPLNKVQWLYTILISLVPLVVMEIKKKCTPGTSLFVPKWNAGDRPLNVK